jgi:outer membrane protein OmpA-like peptidoglycan-associated protein
MNNGFQEEENPFSLSIGDAMAALLLVFILILSAILLELEETKEKQNIVITEYKNLKQEIYKELYKEFKDDLKVWGADLDSVSLSFKFNEPDVLFASNSSVLKPEFQRILNDFFPRYVRILRKEQFIKNIEEIRIEGHTSSEWFYTTTEDFAYIENMRLSQDRTRTTLDFVLSQLENSETKNWAKSLITANGLSSSQLVLNKDNSENKEASRRVEFRVRTDAEQRIDDLLRIIED